MTGKCENFLRYSSVLLTLSTFQRNFYHHHNSTECRSLHFSSRMIAESAKRWRHDHNVFGEKRKMKRHILEEKRRKFLAFQWVFPQLLCSPLREEKRKFFSSSFPIRGIYKLFLDGKVRVESCPKCWAELAEKFRKWEITIETKLVVKLHRNYRN